MVRLTVMIKAVKDHYINIKKFVHLLTKTFSKKQNSMMDILYTTKLIKVKR